MTRPSLRRILLASVAAEPLEVANYLVWCDKNGHAPRARINVVMPESPAEAAVIAAAN